MTKKLSLLACLLCAVTAVGCGDDGAPTTTETIRVALVMDETGTVATDAWDNARTLAQENLNAAFAASEAYSNLRVEMVLRDSTNTPATAVMRAQEFAAEGYKVLVSDTSADTVAIMKTYYDDDPSTDIGMPVVGVLASSGAFNNPNVTNPDPITQAAFRDTEGWHYNVILETAGQSRPLLDLAQRESSDMSGDVNGDGTWKVAVFASDEPLGRAVTGGLRATAGELDADAVVDAPLFPADADLATYDWNGLIDQLIDDQTVMADGTTVTDVPADVIITGTFNRFSAELIKVAAERNDVPPMIHYSAIFNDTLFDVIPAGAADGMKGSVHAIVDPSPEGTTFRNQYEPRFGNPIFHAAKTYDACIIAVLAQLKASVDAAVPVTAVTPDQIRVALGQLSEAGGNVVGPDQGGLRLALDDIAAGTAINYEGASAPLDFDERRRIRTRVETWTIQNDAFVLQNPYYDCTDAACPRRER